VSRFPGRVMQGVSDALAEHGALSYEALTILIFGPDFTFADRNSAGRAIRAMERKGEVKIFYDLMTACVRRADFDLDNTWQQADWTIRRDRRAKADEARSQTNGEIPHCDDATASPVVDRLAEIERMSRTEMIMQDPSIGDRQDCDSCGMPYAECFVLRDTTPPGVMHWCCFECYHEPLTSRRLITSHLG
jgi:hypothetical protein